MKEVGRMERPNSDNDEYYGYSNPFEAIMEYVGYCDVSEDDEDDEEVRVIGIYLNGSQASQGDEEVKVIVNLNECVFVFFYC